MTPDIEKNLTELGQALGSDDSIVKNVMSRIEGDKIESPQPTYNVWRIIMKSKMIKFAAAAGIVLVAMASITLLDKTITPAWAIEQTIEAMRSMKSIHAFTTDWDDSHGECWVQVNPETGQEEYNYADQGNLLIVATPQATYFYHKDKNIVRIQKGYSPASSVSISKFLEELPKWVQEHGGKYEFHTQFDENLQKKIIMVHVVISVMEKEFYVRIDSQTKLPINIEAISSKPGQGVKSVDSIEYNVPIPERIFNFEIPEGAKVIDQ